MDKLTLLLLDELIELAAADLATKDFSRQCLRLSNPTHERMREAGELLVERAADRFPELDPYVASNADGNLCLVLDRTSTRRQP